MKLSELILERIKNDHALDGYVKGSVAKISDHISSNSMIFFPEYTDHDISHFEAVMETAVDLATEKSFELMSDVDFAILAISVMLHDLGMHLTKDGFETLIRTDGPLRPITGFDDVPWNELWLSFLAEARRFDAHKLESLFGPNYEPVTTFPSFNDPWNEFDYLLVGEFLRRHHPRLAHEIALQGMPSVDGGVLRFSNADSEQEKFLCDISGLIARSHGIGLRQTFPYLESNYSNKIEIRSAHPVFLMTLLRIADYLQIQSARAPSARTQVSKFKSPVSTREWSVHQCVTDITNISDPEAIDITARPGNIDTYLRLKYWIQDLQTELDISWAVLGEVYGLQAHSGLNKLGLRIRRIKSNIDHTNSFSKTVEYIPEQISFTTAGSELLKLLVGPLYANDTSIGLRELVQNSTDAVKELDKLTKDGSISLQESRKDISGDVQIDFILDADNHMDILPRVTEVIVTDRGVGMTSDIINNYFLRAGASFRNSNAWKEKFEKSDGSSKIQRSGRFGVGALAAFLLGDEIYVETRHYSEPNSNGLKFSAGIDTSSINVMRHCCDIGTKIRIKIPSRLQQEVGKLLPPRYSYNVNTENAISQYFGRYPKLTYKAGNKEIPWDEKSFLPSKAQAFEDPWNYFETENYEVNWSYAKGAPKLAVNQIRVSQQGADRYGSYDAGIRLNTSIFDVPSLSVGDNSGSFPLNLQRSTYASSKLSFAHELLRNITDEFAFTCLWQLAQKERKGFPRYNGFHKSRFGIMENFWWLQCSDGLILNNPQFLKAYNPSFAFVRYGGPEDEALIDDLIGSLPKNSIAIQEADDEFSNRKFSMKGKLSRILQGESLRFISKSTTAQTVYVPISFAKLIKDEMRPGKDATMRLDNLEMDSVEGWFVQKSPSLSEPEIVRQWRGTLQKDGRDTSVVSLHRLECSNFELEGNDDSVVFERWHDLFGKTYLPKSHEELKELQKLLKIKIDKKYDVFERRAKEAEDKRKSELDNL
jgi:Histidine kinase-, DNA gyrase B-, and HSP90-like ATPase